MAQQTAVEWLVNNLIQRDLIRQDIGIKAFLDASLKQAKQIEKEQIEDAFSAGYDFPEKDCEQYYNETYGENKD